MNKSSNKVIERWVQICLTILLLYSICWGTVSISNASETDKYVEAKILYPLANPYLWKSSIGSVGCEVKFETPYGIMKMPCADYKLNLIKAAK